MEKKITETSKEYTRWKKELQEPKESPKIDFYIELLRGTFKKAWRRIFPGIA